MISERDAQAIAAYIPSPPDPELDSNEFYYLQNGKTIRVFALDILPHDEGTEYGIYQRKGARLVRIDAGYGDPFRGVRMHDLYDNREDCKAQTHWFTDSWQRLRELQQKFAAEVQQ